MNRLIALSVYTCTEEANFLLYKILLCLLFIYSVENTLIQLFSVPLSSRNTRSLVSLPVAKLIYEYIYMTWLEFFPERNVRGSGSIRNLWGPSVSRTPTDSKSLTSIPFNSKRIALTSSFRTFVFFYELMIKIQASTH